MRPLSLLAVFLIAKIVVLANHDVPFSWWAPIAYLWQDVLVTLVFAVIDRVVRRDGFGWTLYGVIVLYTAINLPLTLMLSSPLTWTMMRAVRGTLADSIRHHLTAKNLSWMALILCAGIVPPLLVNLKRFVAIFTRRQFFTEPHRDGSRNLRFGMCWCFALVIVALGPVATAHVNTSGLHRNPLFALAASAFPRVQSRPAGDEWRRSPFEVQTAAITNLGSLLSPVRMQPDHEPGRADFHVRPDFIKKMGGGGTPPSRRFMENPLSPCAGIATMNPPPTPPTRGEAQPVSQFRGAAAGRNIIMVSLESTGAKYLRACGAREDPTPNLTAFTRQAIVCESAYSVYPESIKGLFSVLCSRYPAFDTKPELYQRVTTPSVAQRLVEAGYRTALFHSGRFMYLGMEAIIRHRGFQTLEDAGDIGGNRNSSFGVDEPATVHRILNWIDTVPRDQRFFVTYLPIAGHHPYDRPGPGPFPEQNEIDRYRNALHYGDAALGELLDGLRTRGLDQNTLFIVFGDHGEAFGQHEGNYGHTLFIYEENVRVPLFIAAPGLVREQVRLSGAASLIDIAPTILDLLGLPAPIEYQGQTLLDGRKRLALFYTDYSLGLLGLRDDRWKLIQELESGRSKLFDLERDAEEKVDLARQFPERVAAYRRHLERWSAAQRDLILRSQSHPAK